MSSHFLFLYVAGEKAEVTVTVTKDTAGKVTEASAEVTGTKAEISAEIGRAHV